MKRKLKIALMIGVCSSILFGGASGCKFFYEGESPYCSNDDQQSRVFCSMSKALPRYLGSDDVQYFDVCASASLATHMRMFLETSHEAERVSVVGGLCDVQSALEEVTGQWLPNTVDLSGVEVILVLPNDQEASVFENDLRRLGASVKTYSIEKDGKSNR